MKMNNTIQRLTISIPKSLLEEIMGITKQKKKTKAINIACREFVKMKQKETLLSLKGHVNFKDGENE